DAAARTHAGVLVEGEERRRSIEADRLGDRVPRDVHRDAGERERRAEPEPECDHAHVLEARVGKEPLPRQRPPEKRHGDRERHESACRPPAGERAARRTMPSSATPSPSEVRIRYFQPASSARGLPLKPTRSADAAVVASTRSHAPARLPTSGTAASTAQKTNS